MKLADGWQEFDTVSSTQEEAAKILKEGRSRIGLVFAHDQTAGRGRFSREWLSCPGESLTMSLIFWDYADSSSPWLIGMACAIAAAHAIDCSLRWPNDLFFGDRKVGGVLTELVSNPIEQRVPVVGIGINLGQRSVPAELRQATSVYRETGKLLEPEQAADLIISEIRELPEPKDWSDLQRLWQPLDRTGGKSYRLPDGTVATAIEINENGALRCRVGSEERLVYAADALFGS